MFNIVSGPIFLFSPEVFSDMPPKARLGCLGKGRVVTIMEVTGHFLVRRQEQANKSFSCT